MALMTRELKASFAFVERNFNLTKRYWGWEVAFLVYAVAGALAVSLMYFVVTHPVRVTEWLGRGL